MPIRQRMSASRAPMYTRLPGQGGAIRLHPAVRAISLAACGIALYPAASQPARAQAVAAAAAQQAFDVPAGALAPALRSLASSANLLLIFTEAQTAGKSTKGIKGTYTPQAALALLAAGTGLQPVLLDSGAYVLRAAPPTPVAPAPARGDAAASLSTMTVTAAEVRGGATEGTGSYTTNGSSVATGLNLTLRETPQSVTVVTRQRMDDQGLNSITDVLQQMTGVSSFGLGGGSAASYSWFYVRGFTLDNVLLDGAPIPVNLFGDSVDSIAYDSISLIRGANGLMAGSGEPSGTLSLVRKRPTESFQGSASLSLGRWNERRATVDLGGPLNESGTLRGRVAAAYEKSNSWLQRYNEDKAALYGILEADLGPQSRAWVSFEYGNSEGRAGGPYQFSTTYEDGSPTPFRRGANAFSNWSFNREERTNVTLGFDHRFNDDWSARIQYIHSDSTNTRRFGNVSGSPALDGSVGVYGRRISGDTDPQALSASIDGRYRLWGREHQVVFGFNGYTKPYKDHRGNVAWEDSWPNVFDWQGVIDEPHWDALPDPWERAEEKSKQYGVFVSNRLKVLDSLALITGARVSHWSYRSTNPDTGTVNDERKESGVVTPYLGLVYDLTPHLSTYASYTTIFQPNDQKDQAGRLLDPQDGKSYELGLKGAWFNNRLNASAAVFQTRKNKLAVPDGGLTPTGEDSYVATDHTKSRGWEVEVAGELLPGWSMQAGYGRAVTRDSLGARLLTEAPEQTFKLFTTWTPRAMPALTLGGGAYWQSRIYAAWAEPAALPASTIKPYTVVNLMARYRINPKTSVTVNFNNIFDRSYRVDETAHDYGAPRHLRATLNYQF